MSEKPGAGGDWESNGLRDPEVRAAPGRLILADYTLFALNKAAPGVARLCNL